MVGIILKQRLKDQVQRPSGSPLLPQVSLNCEAEKHKMLMKMQVVLKCMKLSSEIEMSNNQTNQPKLSQYYYCMLMLLMFVSFGGCQVSPAASSVSLSLWFSRCIQLTKNKSLIAVIYKRMNFQMVKFYDGDYLSFSFGSSSVTSTFCLLSYTVRFLSVKILKSNILLNVIIGVILRLYSQEWGCWTECAFVSEDCVDN